LGIDFSVSAGFDAAANAVFSQVKASPELCANLFASQLHTTQLRKGSSVPYAAHLLSVTGIVLQYGGTEDEAIAALLIPTTSWVRSYACTATRQSRRVMRRFTRSWTGSPLITPSLMMLAIFFNLRKALKAGLTSGDEQEEKEIRRLVDNLEVRFAKRKKDAYDGERGGFKLGHRTYFLRVQPSEQNHNLKDYKQALVDAGALPNSGKQKPSLRTTATASPARRSTSPLFSVAA
jgi:hypothetical protein